MTCSIGPAIASKSLAGGPNTQPSARTDHVPHPPRFNTEVVSSRRPDEGGALCPCLSLHERSVVTRCSETLRPSFPNPNRPFRWTGEDAHFRSEFQIGDVVRVDNGSGYLGKITAFNNTWSHLKGGRLVHYKHLIVYPGDPTPDEDSRPWSGDDVAWEDALRKARPGDVASHVHGPRGFVGSHAAVPGDPTFHDTPNNCADPDRLCLDMGRQP